MKKLLKAFSILIASLLILSCGSVDETVTSQISANHITVQQIKSGVKILLNKTAEEDITHIEVIDQEYGNYISVDMGTNLTQSFIWPFSDKDKEYTLLAKLYGVDSYSEESVTFKVENDCTSILSYTEDYLESQLILIASGNKRLVQFETDKNKLMSVFKKASPKNTKLSIEIFSGRKADYSPSTKAIASFQDSIDNKESLQQFIDGFDLIENASLFNLTASQLNQLLSANTKYYAKASVKFTLDENYPEGLIFSTQPLFSNDTVYTPIAAEDLPN